MREFVVVKVYLSLYLEYYEVKMRVISIVGRFFFNYRRRTRIGRDLDLIRFVVLLSKYNDVREGEKS